MQWMARGRNGGYFEMMVGLPHTPAHYYYSLSSPSLAPNPPTSSHLNMSNPQKVSSPPVRHLQNSSLISSNSQPASGAHQFATTPMYLFLVLSVYILLTHPVYCLCGPPSLSIHGSIYTSSSSYLSLLPSSPTKSNCAVDPFHSDCQL